MSNPTVFGQAYSDRVEYYNSANQKHRLDGPAIAHHDGRQVWYKDGKCHREGAPAYFNPNPIEDHQVKESWWLNGKLHRLDGPARTYGSGDKEFAIEGITYTQAAFDKKIKIMIAPKSDSRETFPDGSYCITTISGDKIWYNKSGQNHREDGPAIEYYTGAKYWYQNNLCHRLDGPAIITSSGVKEWWIKGFSFTEHSFNTHPDVIKFRESLKKVDKVVDMSKDKMKVDGEGFFNNVKKNAVTAAPRVLAKTISKGARQGLLQLMKAKKLKKHWIKSIEEMMETEYGLAAISMGLSLVFKYMPGLKDDPRAALICDEFQVGAIELAGNELVDEVMAVMLPAIMQYQSLDLGKTEKLRVAPPKEVMEEEEESVASIPPLQAIA